MILNKMLTQNPAAYKKTKKKRTKKKEIHHDWMGLILGMQGCLYVREIIIWKC